MFNKFITNNKIKYSLCISGVILFIFAGCSASDLKNIDLKSLKEKTKEIKKEDLEKIKEKIKKIKS
jgi:hypothetical protein